MHLPVLGETAGLAYLPPVAIAVATVVPLHEDGVHHLTHQRQRQRRQHGRYRPKHHPRRHLNHPPVRPFLMHRGVLQFLGQDLLWVAGTSATSGPRLLLGHGIDRKDRRFVGRILVRGHQVHQAATRPRTEVLDQLLGLILCAFAGDHTHYQTVFRIEGHMIPVVAVLSVSGFLRVAVLLLLADEGPLLVELHLTSPRGKKPRLRRGLLWRAGRRPPPGVPRYFC